ncbi:tyrosine-type recombinase/integrase [Mycobacterium sp.]|uniref:tyrosine-type recombinase/integrase n=1 Tax=Mycobacterium sp. TaxID=1785 RepID=UPI003C70A596
MYIAHAGACGCADRAIGRIDTRNSCVDDEARAKENKTGDEPTTPTFPRITAHDLRHTAASLAISAGANVKVVQRMLGHASAAMTLDVYDDLFDSDQDAVADKLEDVFAAKCL